VIKKTPSGVFFLWVVARLPSPTPWWCGQITLLGGIVNNNQAFQHRLEKVVKADVTHNRNGWWQLSLETSPGFLSESEIIYEFNAGLDAEDIGCFVGTTRDGAAVNCFMHPGDDKCHGGYGKAIFHLKMKDGSLRSIRGPWSGRPSIHLNYGAPEYMLVTLNDYTHVGLTIDFVKAILEKFNLEFVIKAKYDADNEKHLELATK
jgi:hypothetical protein